MQSLRLNPLLNTDSYKLTHWWQYPPGTRHIYSYVESRGGMFEETMLALLQYIVKSNFAGQVFTPGDIEEARRFAHAHYGGHPKTFNYEGFQSLYAKHGGRLPLRIRAVKEGTVVKSRNALITIENTDPEFYWLTNWAETVLELRAQQGTLPRPGAGGLADPAGRHAAGRGGGQGRPPGDRRRRDRARGIGQAGLRA